MTDEVKVLSDDEVTVVAAKKYLHIGQRDVTVAMDEVRNDIDSLCATVRALRERLTACEGSRRVRELDNHHNALACGYCSGPLKDELLRLQSQIQYRSQK